MCTFENFLPSQLWLSEQCFFKVSTFKRPSPAWSKHCFAHYMLHATQFTTLSLGKTSFLLLKMPLWPWIAVNFSLLTSEKLEIVWGVSLLLLVVVVAPEQQCLGCYFHFLHICLIWQVTFFNQKSAWEYETRLGYILDPKNESDLPHKYVLHCR